MTCLRFLLLVLFLLGPITAQAAEPKVRVVMPQGAPYLAGQRVQVEVHVLVPNYFLSPIQFPVIDIPGAVVTLSEDRSPNFSETVDGETYAGISRSYIVIPLQAGTFVLPAARLTFTYAAVPGQAAQGAVTLPQTHFSATLPTGAIGPDGPLPLVPLEISQSFDPDPVHLTVGDTLIRTVDVYARGMQAMMIPPPRIATPAGLKAYPHDPRLTDERQHDIFTGGRRVDRVTYELVAPGDYTFSAVSIAWYKAANGKPEVARAPELKVHVAAAGARAPEIAPEVPKEEPPPWLRRIDWTYWLPRNLLGVAAIFILVFAAIRYLPRLRTRIAARRQAYQQTEPALFEKLEQALRTGDRLSVWRALSAWSNAADIKSLPDWARRLGNEALVGEIDRLNRDLFSGRETGEPWRAEPLHRELVQARKAYRRRPAVPIEEALPALNPHLAKP